MMPERGYHINAKGIVMDYKPAALGNILPGLATANAGDDQPQINVVSRTIRIAVIIE